MRLRADTLHILDASTNKCLCHVSNYSLLPKLRKEFGVSLRVVPEWQMRLDRMRLRFGKEDEQEAVESRPLIAVLSSPLRFSPEMTQGEYLNFRTKNFNPLRH